MSKILVEKEIDIINLLDALKKWLYKKKEQTEVLNDRNSNRFNHINNHRSLTRTTHNIIPICRSNSLILNYKLL